MALARSCKQQHVVAVPVPAQGHLNPLMRFCRLLASHHGFLVTFVDIDPVHYRMQDLLHAQAAEEHAHHNIPADCPAPPEASDEAPSPNIRRAHIPIEGLDLASDFRLSLQLFFEAQNSIAPHLELFIRKLNRCGPPVTCIVSDVGMTVPTQNVADNLNIPRIALCSSSASLLTLCHHIVQGEKISITKVMDASSRRAERREVIGERLTGLPTIYNDDLPWFKHVVDDNRYLWELTTKVCEETFRRARAIVINSFEDLEAPALTALSKHVSPPVYAVGPLVEPLQKESSTSLWKEDEACILWLDQQPPRSVLYISFGSISLLPEVQIQEIVEGLLCSQQRFLWVFRPDLVENVENSSNLVSDILSRSDGKGYIVDWAPQIHVLSHPGVGGFLTHCGWNSTVEAIAHGVPMLCWPYFADQFLNAKYVVEVWEVGLRFEASRKEGGDGVVERGEVERVVRAVMEGEEGRAFRKHAMQLKEAGTQSLVAGGTSHNNMQALLRSFLEYS